MSFLQKKRLVDVVLYLFAFSLYTESNWKQQTNESDGTGK